MAIAVVIVMAVVMVVVIIIVLQYMQIHIHTHSHTHTHLLALIACAVKRVFPTHSSSCIWSLNWSASASPKAPEELKASTT
jgi:hypothetical protein